MSLPLVSICIPSYNQGLYVAKTIQSAIDQTYENIEIVIVDDASTDNSMEVINTFKDTERVVIFGNSENAGNLGNHHRSFEYSKGDYVVFLHSDDMLMPDFIKKCVQVFEGYDVGMVATEIDLIDRDDNTLGYIPFYDNSYIIPGIKQAKVFLMTNFLCPGQVLIKRSVFEKVGMFDIRFRTVADWDLWFKICLQSDIAYLNEKLSLRRIHDNNLYVYGIKSMESMFDTYTLKLDFLKRVKGNSYLEGFSKEAITKLAKDCINVSVEMLKINERDIAIQYLNLARVFDIQIEDERSFKTISYCINSGSKDPFELIKKIDEAFPTGVGSGKPYNAPEGAIKLRI